jgi:hypothetical protein
MDPLDRETLRAKLNRKTDQTIHEIIPMDDVEFTINDEALTS